MVNNMPIREDISPYLNYASFSKTYSPGTARHHQPCLVDVPYRVKPNDMPAYLGIRTGTFHTGQALPNPAWPSLGPAKSPAGPNLSQTPGLWA